jgi:MFS family permease
VNAALGATQPLVPLYVASLGGNVAQVGLVTSAYNLTSVPSSVFWGGLSDRLSRRKIFILFGFISAGLIFLMFTLASDVVHLVFFNALLGLFLTAYIPVASMMIVEVFPKRKLNRYIGLYNQYAGLGWSLGITAGTIWLSYYDIRMFFTVCSSLCFISALLGVWLIRDPEIALERKQAFAYSTPSIVETFRYLPTVLFQIPEVFEPHRLRRLMLSSLTRSLPLYYISMFCFFTAFNMFFVPLPIFYSSLGIPDNQIFLLFLAGSLTSTIFYPRVGRRSERIGERRLINIAGVVRIAMFSFIGIFGSFIGALTIKTSVFAACMAVFGLTWALFWVSGSSILPKLSDPTKLGQAQGMLNAVIGVAVVAGSLIGGLASYSLSYTVDFLLATLILIFGLSVLTRVEC